MPIKLTMELPELSRDDALRLLKRHIGIGEAWAPEDLLASLVMAYNALEAMNEESVKCAK